MEQVEIDLIKKIKEKDHIIIAIDGMCASFKTTYATYLKEKYNARVIHMDDFYLPKSKRTTTTFDEDGGNIDTTRFIDQIINHLDSDISYISYSCKENKYCDPTVLKKTKVTIIEGAYSLLPIFGKYFDLAYVFVTTKEEQLKRLEKREKDKINDFVSRWIKLENRYLENYQILKKYPIIKLEEE